MIVQLPQWHHIDTMRSENVRMVSCTKKILDTYVQIYIPPTSNIAYGSFKINSYFPFPAPFVSKNSLDSWLYGKICFSLESTSKKEQLWRCVASKACRVLLQLFEFGPWPTSMWWLGILVRNEPPWMELSLRGAMTLYTLSIRNMGHGPQMEMMDDGPSLTIPPVWQNSLPNTGLTCQFPPQHKFVLTPKGAVNFSSMYSQDLCGMGWANDKGNAKTCCFLMDIFACLLGLFDLIN